MSEIQVQLCINIIKDHYGGHVAEVGRHLLVYGRCSLAMVISALVFGKKFSAESAFNSKEIKSNNSKQNVKMTSKRIRESLYVLLQHYLVTYADEVEGNRVITYYEADPEAIIDRVGLPLYTQIIHEELGSAEADIYLRILYHGRTSPDYIINNEFSAEETNLVLKCFATLLKGNWISSVSVDDSLTSEDQNLKAIQDEINRLNQGMPVSNSEVNKIKQSLVMKRNQNTLQSELRDSAILGNAAFSESGSTTTPSKRKLVLDNIDFDDLANNDTKKIKTEDTPVEEIKEEMDTEDLSNFLDLIQAMEKNRHILFRYNSLRSRERIRNSYIGELTLERFNKGAFYLVKHLLELSEQSGSCASRRLGGVGNDKGLKNALNESFHNKSNFFVMNPSKELLSDRSSFVEPINELSLGASLSSDEKDKLLIAETASTLRDVIDPVKEYLQYISGDHKFGLLVQCREISSRHWSINLMRSRQLIRQNFLESVIEERFGESCKRIFRILIDREKLTEAQVAKIALMDPKTVRHCLYLMHGAGLAFIQDVPKTLDHAAARTYFLWYASLDKAIRTFENNCYKVLFNIRTRRNYEVDSRKDLIEKSVKADVIAQQNEGKKSILTDHETRSIEHLNASVKKLTTSELRVMRLLIAIR